MERKEAMEIVRKLYNDSLFLKKDKEAMVTLIPELKKSEDKIIKEEIIDFLRLPHPQFVGKRNHEEWIAWLEKQGEQKPADKVEQKFHEGDWITNNIETVQITGYDIDYGYQVDYKGNLQHRDTDIIEKEYHLWTIQDAKDGDVLCTYECDKPKIVFILKGTPKKHYALSYHCYCNIMYPHFASDSEKGCLAPNDEDVKPATKEQRDTLERAMHNAGYEWDADTKELKKISNALEECEIEHIEHGKYYYCIKDYYSGGCKRVSKGEVVQALRGMSMIALGVKANEYFIPVKCIIDNKVAWSEEDDNIIEWLIGYLEYQIINVTITGEKDNCLDAISMLKSLKDKVQLRQEWSEVDKMQLDAAINIVANSGHTCTSDWLKALKERVQLQNGYNPYKEVIESIAEMCKHYDKISHNSLRDFYDNVKVKCKDAKEYDSLYPQTTWKPSDSQIECLSDAIKHYNSQGFTAPVLKELLEQLKKLREK